MSTHVGAAESGRGVQSVDRALDILMAFSSVHPTLTLGELSEVVNLPKSSTHRLAAALAERGFLRREADGGYSLGGRLLELGGMVSNSSPLSRLTSNVTRTLSEQTHETILVAEVDWIDNTVLITHKEEGRHLLNVASPIGKRSGLGNGCIGKAVMSALPDAQVAALLTEINLARRTERSVTSKAILLEELKRANKIGWAIETNEFLEDVSGVAIPVIYENRPIGAIAIIAPSSRASKSNLASWGRLGRSLLAKANDDS